MSSEATFFRTSSWMLLLQQQVFGEEVEETLRCFQRPQVAEAIKIFEFSVDKGDFFVLQKFVCNKSNQY